MSAFEFYTVLISFFISIAVASLLSAIGRLIQERHRVRWSWSHLLWTLVIFNLMIVFWIRSWSYHDTFELRLTFAGPPLLLAIFGYMACALATPVVPEQGEIDLDAFHREKGPLYMGALALFMVFTILQVVVMDAAAGVPESQRWEDMLIPALLALVALAAALRPGLRWLQILAPSTYLIASAVYYVRLIGV